MSEIESKTVAVLWANDVKGWRLSTLDLYGRRTYSSPVVSESICVSIEHDIQTGLIEDEGWSFAEPTVAGRIKVEGSDLLAPHLENGHIGLEVWTRFDISTVPADLEYLKKYPLRWWVFPNVLSGTLYESPFWGNGPDGDFPAEARGMWNFVPTKARREFPEKADA